MYDDERMNISILKEFANSIQLCSCTRMKNMMDKRNGVVSVAAFTPKTYHLKSNQHPHHHHPQMKYTF